MSARRALLALAERDGSITPRSVLDEARDPANPLHTHFTWDDGEAAERYRLVEAGRLIRRYKITIETPPETVVRVRAFSSVESDDGPSYYPTTEAMANPQQRDFIMQQAVREIAALRMKYQHLVDFNEALRLAAEQAAVGRRGARRAAGA